MAGEGAALASAFLWALSNILIGSQSGKMPALVISALRSLYAAVFLAAVVGVAALAGAASFPNASHALGLAGSGAVGMGVGDTFYIASLSRVGVSRSFPISMAVYPLLTLLLAVAWLGEDVTARVVLGTVLIIVGVYLIVFRGADVTGVTKASPRALWLGLALVLGSAVLWAVASVWLRTAADGVQPLTAQALRLPAAAVVALAAMRSAGHRTVTTGYPRRGLAALVITGVVGTALGSMLFVVAVQEAGAARTAVLSSCAPLFALPMAALFLGERITARIAVGTVLSVAGIWLVV